MPSARPAYHPLIHRHVGRALTVALIILTAATLFGFGGMSVRTMLLLWDIVALSYLILAGINVWRSVKRHNTRQAPDKPQNTRQSGISSTILDMLIVLLASAMGLVVAVYVVSSGLSSGSPLTRLLAAISILSAWLIMQGGFTGFYAHAYHNRLNNSGLDFPKTDDPDLIDFFYFSFSVGATFQVSDVDTTDPFMRWLVTLHAIISFFYNSAIVALAVNLLTGD